MIKNLADAQARMRDRNEQARTRFLREEEQQREEQRLRASAEQERRREERREEQARIRAASEKEWRRQERRYQRAREMEAHQRMMAAWHDVEKWVMYPYEIEIEYNDGSGGSRCAGFYYYYQSLEDENRSSRGHEGPFDSKDEARDMAIIDARERLCREGSPHRQCPLCSPEIDTLVCAVEALMDSSVDRAAEALSHLLKAVTSLQPLLMIHREAIETLRRGQCIRCAATGKLIWADLGTERLPCWRLFCSDICIKKFKEENQWFKTGRENLQRARRLLRNPQELLKLQKANLEA